MKASDVSQSLEILAQNKQPIFLWGPPGIGKSQVVKQTADRIGVALLDVRAILLDPVDLRGIPHITSEGLTKWCAPSFLPQQGQGILFLDELNAAPPLVQAACYQLVLDRQIGEYHLPDGWSIVAAGNREQDRAVTHKMPSALANRFVHIDFTVDFKEWIRWAQACKLAPEIIAFLQFRPALLHDFDPEKSGRAFPSPRSWEFASKLICGGAGDAILYELLEGTVGKAATVEFSGFMKIYHQLPELERILAEPQTIDLPSDPSVLFAICEMVGKSASLETAENVMAFANRLPEEFGVLLVREAVRHCQEIARNEAFASWAASHAEILV